MVAFEAGVIVDPARPLYQADHYRWYKKSHGWRRGHAPTAPLIYHAYYYFYYHYLLLPLPLQYITSTTTSTTTTHTTTKYHYTWGAIYTAPKLRWLLLLLLTTITTPLLLQRTSWVSQYNLSHLLERVARWQFIYQAQAGSLKGTGGRLCSNIW